MWDTPIGRACRAPAGSDSHPHPVSLDTALGEAPRAPPPKGERVRRRPPHHDSHPNIINQATPVSAPQYLRHSTKW